MDMTMIVVHENPVDDHDEGSNVGDASTPGMAVMGITQKAG